jgi:5-methylcytosine-specific restriction endonuclease McrA
VTCEITIAEDAEARRAKKRAYYWKNRDRMCAKAKKWREQNRDKARASVKAWDAANPEKRRANTAAWRSANLDKARALQKASEAANPGKRNARTAVRRARRLRATPAWVDRAAIREIYEIAAFLGQEVDHIHPLKGENFCGLHVPWNLQLLSSVENRSKGTKLLPEYAS